MVDGGTGRADHHIRRKLVIDIMTHVFDRLISSGGIAGLIAMVISVSICARYVKSGPEPVPPVLTHALSTILGFYFGTGLPHPN
jgi:hypothetical protein